MDELDKRRFGICCGLSYKEVLEDIEALVDLTGFESQTELDMLHKSIYHSDDEDYPQRYNFHYEEDFPTAKELETEYPTGQESCSFCPPYSGDNYHLNLRPKKHKGKRGAKKKIKPNKKQGRAAKRNNG